MAVNSVVSCNRISLKVNNARKINFELIIYIKIYVIHINLNLNNVSCLLTPLTGQCINCFSVVQ